MFVLYQNSLCFLAFVVGPPPGVPPGLPLGQGQVGQEGGQRALYLVRLSAQSVLCGAVVGALAIETDVVGCMWDGWKEEGIIIRYHLV